MTTPHLLAELVPHERLLGKVLAQLLRLNQRWEQLLLQGMQLELVREC